MFSTRVPASVGSPTPRRPVCALRDPRPGPRPSRTIYAGLGVSAVKKAWPKLGGWSEHGQGFARQRPPVPLPPALPASLTFALGSGAIETATCGSAAPQLQLQEEGAAAEARRGGGGAGGGAGAGGGPEARGLGGLRRERAPALCAPPTTHNSYDLWEMLEPHGSQCLLSSRIGRSGYRPSPGGGPHHGLRPQTGWSCRSTLVLRPLPFTYCGET